MDNDKTDNDDLITREPVVERIQNPNERVEVQNPTLARTTVFKWAGFVLVLVGAVVAFTILYSSPTDTNESSEDAVQASIENETTLEELQQNVVDNQLLWSADVVKSIELYDQGNDNVNYKLTETTITLQGNGLPNHTTGNFPNKDNPNSISEQDFGFNIPRAPVYVGTASPVRVFGVSLGGVPMEPGTAETDPTTGWNIEAFNVSRIFAAGVDDNNAHVQPNGTYHYHGLPNVLVTTGELHSNIVGFAADGFPVYADHGYRDPTNPNGPIDHMTSSWRLKSGMRATGEPEGSYTGDYTQDYEYIEGYGDLDECNGRFTVTPDFPLGTYAYFMTETFPYIGRCVKGEVINGFTTR